MKNIFYGVIAVMAVAGSTFGGFLGWEGVQDQSKTYSIGDTIEDFSLTDLTGMLVSLSDIAGESGTIIIYTCNTCPYSKLYEDRILQVEDVYGDAGYAVIIINPNDPNLKPGDQVEHLKKWVADKKFNSAYLIDNSGLHHRFDAHKTPEVFLLDSDLILRYKGAIDNSAQGPESVTNKYLENAIRALENDEDPNPAVTRSVGCIIKSE